MENLRNSGRPTRRAADRFDEASQMHVPRSSLSQQLFYYDNKMRVYLEVKTPANPKVEKPAPQLQWSTYMDARTVAKLNETIDVEKFQAHVAQLEEENTSNRIKTQNAEAKVEKTTRENMGEQECPREDRRT